MAGTYRKAIMLSTGTDEREAAVIEEIMRVERPTLDALTAPQLSRLAVESANVLITLRDCDPETAAFYEQQAGVA